MFLARTEMIAQIIALSLTALAHGLPYQTPVYGSPYVVPQDERPQPYNFNVDVKDEYGTTLNRQEIGDELGNKRGSYGYTDPYGIARQVDYVADEKGFRAIIKTNEPGTENQNPADVEIISNAVQVAPAHRNPSIPAYTQTAPSYGQSSSVIPGISSIGGQTLRPVYPAPAALGTPSNVYGSASVVSGVSSISNQPLRPVYSTPAALAVSSNAYGSVSSQAISTPQRVALY